MKINFPPIILLVTLIGSSIASIQAQQNNLEWIHSFSNVRSEESVVDKAGNVYVVGLFTGGNDFDPGAGVDSLFSNGATDIFIQKFNPTGNLVWAKSIGGPNNEDVKSISVDPWGNIYLTGNYRDSIDFDPGLGVQMHYTPGSQANHDLFTLKISSNGEFRWVNTISTTKSEGGWAIFSDSLGYVYCHGFFFDTVDFDPGPNVFNLSNPQSSIGAGQFIQKLDSSGNFVWATAFQGYGSALFKSIITDAFGNIYCVGHLSGVVDIDPGPAVFNVFNPSAIYSTLLIAKFQPNGAFTWAYTLNNQEEVPQPIDIAIDKAGYLYISGCFLGTLDFDPGPGVTALTSHPTYPDLFIKKLDSNGNFIWVKSWGSNGKDYAKSLAIDKSNHIYLYSLVGIYSQGPDTISFSSGTSVVNFPASIIQKIDSLGNLIWVEQSHGNFNSDWYNRSIHVDSADNIYVSGSYNGTVDFILGPTTQRLTSLSPFEFFLMKINQNGPGLSAIPLAHVPNFTLFPNPASNILTIKSDSPINSITVWSIGGQFIKKTNAYFISVEELPQGIYLVEVLSEKGTGRQTFVKE